MWVYDYVKVMLLFFCNDMFSVGVNDSVNGDGELISFLVMFVSVMMDEIMDVVVKVVSKLQSGIV